MADEGARITELLEAWSAGDQEVLSRLMPLIHNELLSLARGYMGREAPGHTLQATALVNEAYLRLLNINQVEWHDRVHFFAVAARVMRRILVEAARARRAQKRGGMRPVSLDDEVVVSTEPPSDVLALDEALHRLEAMDERKARVVELRFFTGLSVEETAAVLAVSPETIKRDWRFAKAWLAAELSDGNP